MPGLVGAGALEMADHRLRLRLRQALRPEGVDAPGKYEEGVHAVPARVQVQPVLAQDRVERILVAQDEALSVPDAVLAQLARALVAPHQLQVQQHHAGIEVATGPRDRSRQPLRVVRSRTLVTAATCSRRPRLPERPQIGERDQVRVEVEHPAELWQQLGQEDPVPGGLGDPGSAGRPPLVGDRDEPIEPPGARPSPPAGARGPRGSRGRAGNGTRPPARAAVVEHRVQHRGAVRT